MILLLSCAHVYLVPSLMGLGDLSLWPWAGYFMSQSLISLLSKLDLLYQRVSLVVAVEASACGYGWDTRTALTSHLPSPFCPPVASASTGKTSSYLKGDTFSYAFYFNACRNNICRII